MIVNAQGKTEVNSRQKIVTNADGSVRVVFSARKARRSPRGQLDRDQPRKGLLGLLPLVLADKDLFRPLMDNGDYRQIEIATFPDAQSVCRHDQKNGIGACWRNIAPPRVK